MTKRIFILQLLFKVNNKSVVKNFNIKSIPTIKLCIRDNIYKKLRFFITVKIVSNYTQIYFELKGIKSVNDFKVEYVTTMTTSSFFLLL